jgi:ankyrin repeat protein
MMLFTLQTGCTFTALGIAAYNGHTEIVTMMVRAGASVDYQGSQVTLLSSLSLRYCHHGLFEVVLCCPVALYIVLRRF